MQNSDPWTGEETPQVDPYVPDVGSSTGGNQINNNNQTVNINLDNRFSNMIGPGATNEDYDGVIDNIQRLLRTFKQSLGVINEAGIDSDGNPNGFIALIHSTYNVLPGMEYFEMGIAIVVALLVILFIIKALVF